MKEAFELVGALVVLALAWICIAEVFPQYGYVETEREEKEDWVAIHWEGFGEDEGQEDGIDRQAASNFVQLRYEGLEDGSVEIWDSNVQYCKIPAWAIKGFVVRDGLGKPELQESGHWKIF